MDTPDTPPAKPGWDLKHLAPLAGCSYDILKRCPPTDWGVIRVFAGIVIGSAAYQAAIFAAAGHLMFAQPGEIKLELIIPAILLAVFIQLMDNPLFLRSGYERAGAESLRKRGGLDIAGPSILNTVASGSLRGLFTFAIAGLAGISFTLDVFHKDVATRIDMDDLQANTILSSEITSLIDADIKRRTDAVATEEAQVATLTATTNAVRQNAVDPATSDPQVKSLMQEIDGLLTEKSKADDALREAELLASHERGGIKGADTSGVAGPGPRFNAALEDEANAKAHAQDVDRSLRDARARLEALRKQLATAGEATRQRSDTQLSSFESELAAENTKLDTLKDELAHAVQGRNDAIRKGVEGSPHFVKRDDGFLGQMRALDEIAAGNPKINVVLWLIEIASATLEMGAVASKTLSFIQTTYADILVAEGYERTARIADELMQRLNQSAADGQAAPPPDEPPTNDNGPSPANDNCAAKANGAASIFGPPDGPPPKRPRGRPRKSPPDTRLN